VLAPGFTKANLNGFEGTASVEVALARRFSGQMVLMVRPRAGRSVPSRDLLLIVSWQIMWMCVSYCVSVRAFHKELESKANFSLFSMSTWITPRCAGGNVVRAEGLEPSWAV
jgi:hypothetical protein